MRLEAERMGWIALAGIVVALIVLSLVISRGITKPSADARRCHA